MTMKPKTNDDEANRDDPEIVGCEAVLVVPQVLAERADHIWIARKNENSAAARLSIFSSIDATIVEPERDTPGSSDSICASPISPAL